ncbi:MAG: (d)CMP kinase [Bdellovibrionota bacterium]
MELVLNDKQEAIMLLDSKDVTQSLFTREVSQAASKVGALPKVRKFLQPIQRTAFSTAKGIVADGRDVGTVLFPDADFKFFINVDADVRAERRVKQLYPDMNDPQELERLKKELVKEIKERDERDLKRGVAPTVPAKDAKIIDNTATTLTETLNFMYHLVADGAG